MKKSITMVMIILLTALPLLGLLPLNVQAAYAFSGGGDGSSGHPYLIETAEDLDHVRDDLAASYRLQADIDLSSYDNWEPIGTDSASFTGIFDGAGYTISGMTIESSAQYIGLFGSVSGDSSRIMNLRLEQVHITASNTLAQIGGMAGLLVRGTFDHDSVTGEIDGIGGAAGGLVGQVSTSGKVLKSDAHVRLEFSNAYTGGLAGGITSDGTVEQSYATGDVSSSVFAGGLAGEIGAGTILNSYATGSVTGGSTAGLGGMVGWDSGASVITNSYATGTVDAGSLTAGGLVGSVSGIIASTVTSSYWNLTDNPGLQTTGGGTGTVGAVSEDAMKRMVTYAGWDSDIWGIQEGATYPYLKSFAPTLKVDPIAPTYSTDAGNNELTVAGYVQDGSVGEPLSVHYTIKDAANATVTQAVYDIDAATGDNQAFNWSTTLDDSRYAAGTTYTLDVTVEDTDEDHQQLQSWPFAVLDTTAPVIALRDLDVLAVERNSPFTDPGATALDDVDGDLTAQITVSGSVDTTRAGTYTLTYRVSDSSGNEATATRTITVVNRAQPSNVVQPSGNSDLAKLNVYASGELLGLSPEFTAGTLEYSAATEADQVELQVSPAHSLAAVKLQGERIGETATVPLAMGANVLTLTVQAENGTFKTYTLTLNRMAGGEEETSPSASVCAFTDIENHWAQSQICEAAELGIVEGVDAHTFLPNGDVTRTEFAVMLLRTLQLPIPNKSGETSFSDGLSIPEWAWPAILSAVAEKMVDGYPDGTLRPMQTVNRAEMAAMISKSMKWEAARAANSFFSDAAAIPAWASGYVGAAREHGMIEGQADKKFMPEGLTTRAEAAVVLLRLWHALY